MAIDDQIPPGVEVPVPKSREQARKLFSNDKIKNLTKIKIQEYIESFFNTAGENRDLLSAISPRFIHYNTDRSFDPRTDPTQRQLQIARYFDELRNVIPSILIVDGGVTAVPHNIGQISASFIKDGSWHGFFPILRRIPLAIIAAANDLDEADEMSGVMSLMFNELRNLAGGHYITGNQEQGETWAISLPNAPVDVGPLTDIEIGGEPIKKIWYSETEVEILFEDVLAIKDQLREISQGTPAFQVNQGNLRNSLAPIIQIADTISINTQPIVFIRNLQDHYRVILDSAKFATLSFDLRLTPRNFGTFKIQIVDTTRQLDSDTRIVAEKEVQIV